MTKLEKLCIKWLNENFNPMEPFYMEKYPDNIFHMKNGQCILQYNKKCGYVYVSYREIWKFFEGMFSMSNQQIKDITKIWVEEHYKMGVTTDVGCNSVFYNMVEEHYKKSVTINELDSIIANRIEEQYREIKTDYFDAPYIYESENEIQVKTIGPIRAYNENWVNEKYKQKING